MNSLRNSLSSNNSFSSSSATNTSRKINKRPKRRFIPKSFRTLIPLLNTYVGTQVTIELKNDTEITGILDEVMFPSMNCVLVHCIIKSTSFEFVSKDINGEEMWLGKTKSVKSIVQWARTNETRVDQSFVHGSTIRYVHFPDHVNVYKQLAVADKNARSTRQLYERGVRQNSKKEIKR